MKLTNDEKKFLVRTVIDFLIVLAVVICLGLLAIDSLM